MKPGIRVAGFAVVLAAAFGVGAGVGAAIGPAPTRSAAMEPAPIGAGVVSTADGYRLVPSTGTLPATGGRYRFVVDGPDGNPVHAFTALHERMLHLIVVNRELTVYHHVHPTLAPDGTWSVPLPALPPGSYRAVADFHVSNGPRLALGADLAVPGDYQPTQIPAPAGVAAVDGYRVTIGTRAKKGGELTVALTVRRAGRLVTDLQPYLGAAGHLVAMRAGRSRLCPRASAGLQGRDRDLRRHPGRPRPLPVVLRLPTWRRCPYRGIHLRPGRRHRRAHDGALIIHDRHHHRRARRERRRSEDRRHDLRVLLGSHREAAQQDGRRPSQRQLRYRASHGHHHQPRDNRGHRRRRRGHRLLRDRAATSRRADRHPRPGSDTTPRTTRSAACGTG